MSGVAIKPFDETMLDAAADLLAARHTRDRQQQPLLPERFSNPAVARAAVDAVWQNDRTSGVAAWEDGRLVAFLLGEVKIDTLRGRTVWMPLAGHALAKGQPADLYADLYAAAAPRWLDWGAFEHYVLVPSGDAEAAGLWFSLTFGQEQAYALRSLLDPHPVAPPTPGVEIRLLTAGDEDALVDEMAPILSRHMAQAPVWGVSLPEYWSVRREGFAELLAQTDVDIWGAFENGRMVGYQILYAGHSDRRQLFVPEHCCLLELAGTLPEARGRGIGRALTPVG